MRPRGTLILALIFLALGAYLYFVERERVAQEGVREKVLEFDTDAVSRVVLEHPGRKVVLERSGDSWRLTEPLAAAADQRSVDDLLRALHDATIKRTLESADALATYGLDSPSVTIQLSAAGNELPTLKIGKKAPIGGSAYLQRGNGDSVYLTEESILAALDKQANDLRDRTVLDFADEAVVSIDIHNGKGELQLRREESGWRLERPQATAADADNVRSLLTTLRSLRATNFASDDAGDLAPYGLAAPAQRVTLGLEDGTAIDLAVGDEKDGQIYVKSSQRPTVFQIADWLRENLDKDAAYFRDKTILKFDSAEARELQLARPDGSLTLRRSDAGNWSSDAGATRGDAIDQLLAALAALQGYEIAAEAPADLAAYGLEPAALTIRVSAADGADLGTVRLGSYAVEGARTEYAAQREGSDTVFLIREYTYRQLDKQPADLLTLPTPAVQATQPAAAPDAAP